MKLIKARYVCIIEEQFTRPKERRANETVNEKAAKKDPEKTDDCYCWKSVDRCVSST